jgi:hypothetical protein
LTIAITILSWSLYAIALLLKAYANHVRFMFAKDMPLAFSRFPSFASKFWLTRLAITYGSLAGLWFAHGIAVAVGAFFAYFLFCVFTFVKGSRRAINKFARLTFDRRKHEAAELGETFNELAGRFEATKLAEKVVEEQMRRNGNL